MEGFALRRRRWPAALAMAIITAHVLVDLGQGGVEEEPAVVLTHPGDREALRQMKAAIDPGTIRAATCLATWDFAKDPCASASGKHFTCGIECSGDRGDDESPSPSPSSSSSSSSAAAAAAASAAAARPVYRRVRSLILDSAGYGGELSAYVGNLTELRILQLSGNAIGGVIPAAAVSGLDRLERLDLSGNRFSGSIPDAFGRLANRLRALDLSHNRLQGEMPRSLGELASLEELSLQSNGLTGRVPELASLVRLKRLDLSSNRLSGEPPMRRLPSSVSAVSLRNNSFSGRVMRIPGRLAQLAVLDLSRNRLGGRVNGAMLAHPSLQQLNMSGNALIGVRIRPRARALAESSLVALDLSCNLISGRLPAAFALMRQLSALSLRHNSLRGAIPPIYGAKAAADGVVAKPLSRLLLDGNYLVGPLPPQLVTAADQLPVAASLADNCFSHCPFALCQGKTQKTQALCSLFNPPPPP